tara:strand:+ start:2075 stop:2455 length:381 start_codon:yes stop_codon:yes gene_type:complete
MEEEKKITPVENVYVQLSHILSVLEIFCKENEMKFSERRRGVYIRPEDLEKFNSLRDIIENLIQVDMPFITQKLHEEIVERSTYEGKFKQTMFVLEKCYNDYVNNGRSDAIQAITEGLSDQTLSLT